MLVLSIFKMKILLITGICTLLLLTRCQEKKSETPEVVAIENFSLADTESNKDSVLLNLSNQILVSIKNKDFYAFINFMHPDSGIRFSPYAYITTNDKQFNRQDFLKAVNSGKLIDWGIAAGNGDIIHLTVKDYFARFVYDVDFIHAEKTSLNHFLAGGNSLNNLLEFYLNSEFTESYFSGFDIKYGGMDWRTLRLVYKKHRDDFYLVGIVHDEWTP